MDGTAVVTGGSRGIGRAVARTLAEEGMRVVVSARTGDDVDAVAEAIVEAGGQAQSVRADVRDEFDVERLMETAARFGPGRIDLVVANAGVYHGDPGETPLPEESYAAVDDHLRTNGRGTFTTLREAHPHVAEGGRVLVTTGKVAREPTPGIGSYAVSKATAEAVARGFAVDVDYPVGLIDPGQVETDLSGPGGRDPEEVADLFVWAASVDPDRLDGEVLGLREWRQATR